MKPLEDLLSRDRWVVGTCLAMLCLLAWFWLAREAATMSAAPAMDMSAMDGMMMTDNVMPASFAALWSTAFVMWLIMMVAMMLPSAAPMILLYAGFVRNADARGTALAQTVLFAGVYILLWALFSAAAALVQLLLIRAGLVSQATLRLGSNPVAGGLLVLAGLYQLTPLKRACLDQCRSPLSFVMRLWRPGWRGAVRLGLAHGGYCIGCCWLLMALLFAGGVMNLAWVAVLAAIVLIEKAAPIGARGATAIGILAIGAGAVLMLRP